LILPIPTSNYGIFQDAASQRFQNVSTKKFRQTFGS